MKLWIKCTLGDEVPVFVDIDKATTIKRVKNFTRIAFAGGADDYVDFKETPDEIFTLRLNAI